MRLLKYEHNSPVHSNAYFSIMGEVFSNTSHHLIFASLDDGFFGGIAYFCLHTLKAKGQFTYTLIEWAFIPPPILVFYLTQVHGMHIGSFKIQATQTVK
jgi:hypothetical protein